MNDDEAPGSWDEFRTYFSRQSNVVDAMLKQSGQEAPADPKRLKAGDRVKLIASLESLVAYSNPPINVEGTVVLIRTGAGTHGVSFNGKVAVKWDDGIFRHMFASHLVKAPQKKRADSFRMYFQTMGEVLPSFSLTATDNELVHKSTNDLWAFRNTGEAVVLERLFSSTGEPIKDG